MSLVATLVSSPADPQVTDTLVRDLAALVQAEAVILAPGEAADLFLTPEATAQEAESRLVAALDGAPVDIVVQPHRHRRKALMLADMDSTMIGQECIDELAAELGIKDRIAAITERAMRGEVEFESALRERVALLKGLDVSVVDRLLEDRIVPTPGGRTLVATMRANGARCVLVSGGFTLFTKAVAASLGFDENRANTLVVADGRLTGEVADPILGADAKRGALIDLRGRYGLSREQTLAVGDGANDLPMLEEAGLGVAFRAKPKVAAAADARIDHADLTALLYAQGYKRSDFIA